MKNSNELANEINKILTDAGAGANTDNLQEFDQSMNVAITALALVTGRYLNHFVMIRSLKTGADPVKLIRASAESINDLIERSATDSMQQIMSKTEDTLKNIKKGH